MQSVMLLSLLFYSLRLYVGMACFVLDLNFFAGKIDSVISIIDVSRLQCSAMAVQLHQ